MPEDDTIGRIIQRDLDRLPLLPADRWVPRAAARRVPLYLTRLTSAIALVLVLAVAIGVGQGVRGLRERVAGNLPPDAAGSVGASAVVPPHLASPDSIAVLYDTKVTIRSDQAVSTASVTVIDSQTGAVRWSLPVATQAQAVFRAAGAELIVIDWPTDGAQRIQFVDAETGAITGTITEPRPRPSLGAWPELGAAVSPDGKLLALQQLGTLVTNSPVQADVVAFYDLQTRSRTVDAALFTPGCGPGELGFTDDGRNLFLACSTTQFFVVDAATRKAVANGYLPPQGRFPPRAAGFGGMAVIGSSATVLSADGQDRFVIRTDGSVSSGNLGQLFSDTQVVPAGALARVPRQGRLFVGYGPAGQGTVVDARIMDEGSSGGRFTITRQSVGGLLADDRGNLFGAAADGSIWRRGSTQLSNDDATLAGRTAGRSARLLGMLRVTSPTVLTRDQAIRVMSAPNIRVDRVDRVEAKLVTLSEALTTTTTPTGYLDGVDLATPVWVVALRGEMHAIRGLIDIDAKSALFVLDAQTGQSIAFFSTQQDWPTGFDALADRAPAAAGPSVSPRVPNLGGAAPIGDVAARVACDGKLGSARLVAAFDSTAGVVADWVENVAYPDAPHVVSSEWRRLAPSAPAYVCYFDGQFSPPGGGPVSPGASAGATVPPLIGRALILVDSSGTQHGPSKYGPTDSLPLARPGGRF